jgi:glycosyltransferase involved in cell wall biosynthesis
MDQKPEIIPVSILILTLNEEINLSACLASIGWCDDIVVLDSFSSDTTADIATAAGATVVKRRFENWSTHQNWAMENIQFKHEWVFYLDADERMTPEVIDEIKQISCNPDEDRVAFYCGRRNYLMSRWIKHAMPPVMVMRFFKPPNVRFERLVNPTPVIKGSHGYLKNYFDHYSFNKGLTEWIDKHNRYSQLEAIEGLKLVNQRSGTRPSLLSKDPAQRRMALKNLSFRLPFRPWIKFFYMYFFKQGVLDGRAGLTYCALQAIYEYMIAIKMKELRQLGEHGSLYTPPAPSTAEQRSYDIQSSMAMLVMKAGGDAWTPHPTSLASTAHRIHQETAPPPSGVDRRQRITLDDLDTLRERLQPDCLPPGQWPEPRSVPISVLIPTKNEQINVAECIRHVLWAKQIVVVDSYSTDGTITVAKMMGAEVYQFDYPQAGWPKKKNWALEHLEWENEWVLILDADELMTPQLADQVKNVVTNQLPVGTTRHDGYWLNRQFMFMGRWIKGCGYYPSYNIRLLKHRSGRYERIGTLGDTGSGDNEVHEHIVLSTGQAGYLKGDFLHYAYPDLTTWIEKHNRYSKWEAHAMDAKISGGLKASMFGGPIERRRWIKQLVRRMPFRPTMRFFYSYILQRGFLDGYPGYVMCRLMAWYEFISIAKHKEMKIHLKQGGSNR